MGAAFGLSAANALAPSIQAADAADALMNSRLVNFMTASCIGIRSIWNLSPRRPVSASNWRYYSVT
jgi:hypothetical protein